MSFDPLVVCIDVGSTNRGKFGWWSSDTQSGTSPSGVADHVATALNNGVAVALGFECPLFVPISRTEATITAQRPGEGNRSWSAAAGLGAMGVGIAQVPWVLREVRLRTTRNQEAYLDWQKFQTARCGLFIWEAFVSGNDKGKTHIADAEIAVRAFLSASPHPGRANRIGAIQSVYSLAGAALLRTRWSNDLSLLEIPVLVVGPAKKRVRVDAPYMPAR